MEHQCSQCLEIPQTRDCTRFLIGIEHFLIEYQHLLDSNWELLLPNKAVLEPRVSPAFAIAYLCNHCNIRFENTSKYVDTLTLFSKNLNQRSLTPRRHLTPCPLRSHVWLYPRIIVSKSHGKTSMYVDTVINFANYHIHTYIHTPYRMSDHIVSYWTQFRRDNYWTQFRRDKKKEMVIWHLISWQSIASKWFILSWWGPISQVLLSNFSQP